MEKKRMRSMTAITLRLAALVLGVWLLCMALLTVGTAQYVHQDLLEQGESLAKNAGNLSGLDGYYDDFLDNLPDVKAVPGLLDHAMLRSLEGASVTVSPPLIYGEDEVGRSVFAYGQSAHCDVALAFVDSQGRVLHQSGDFLSFQYFSQETWLSGEDVPNDGYAWLDLSDPRDERYRQFRTSYQTSGDLLTLCALRVTGVFHGPRFEPYALDLMTMADYDQALAAWLPQEAPDAESGPSTPVSSGEDYTGDSASTGGSSSTTQTETPPHTYGLLDSLGLVEWQPVFDHTAQAEPGEKLVTIYGTQPTMLLYDKGGRVGYWEGSYPSLLDLVLSKTGEAASDVYSFSQASDTEGLWNTVVLSARSYTDFSGGFDFASEEDIPSPDFILLAAVHASPMRIAMGFLWKIYLLTGLVALAGFLLARGSVKKHLVRPVEEVNHSMAANWSRLPILETSPPKWREPWLLSRQYTDMQDVMRGRKNEIARLNTALNYARTAEENRRQMISHLTHQLKTPLAVIHGYAEGLREHIAEDKRDHYVEMILSETERCDKMVLEMLDLSRLEAGKVKLSRDQVSLRSLIQYTLEKLERPIAEKQLQVEFLSQEEGLLAGDESRLAQVIENFFTNAVKYTPKGGWIRAELERDQRKITFALKNQSPPLSQEDLDKVWEPFYRGKDAQTEEGTGLGLAIVKTIIELHGGECFALNIDQGVSFGFRISQ